MGSSVDSADTRLQNDNKMEKLVFQRKAVEASADTRFKIMMNYQLRLETIIRKKLKVIIRGEKLEKLVFKERQ